VISNRGGCERRGWRWAGQVTVIVALLALMAGGCGGSSNTNITPFAGVWVANSGAPNVLHFSGPQVSGLAGVANVPPTQLLTNAGFVSPQDTLWT
jgi:hypothetical protein